MSVWWVYSSDIQKFVILAVAIKSTHFMHIINETVSIPILFIFLHTSASWWF